jgi:hypothetical protein
MQPEARKVPDAPDAQLSVSKRFGRYKDEDEKAVRAPDIVEDQTLKQLRAAWHKMKWCNNAVRNYSACLKAIKGLEYISKDVEKFSVACIQFQNEDLFWMNVGLFLSALINNCPDRDFVIQTRHLSTRINFLGYKNTKNIIVEGDAYSVGNAMEGGKITVKGSAGLFIGHQMKDGRITVEGNVASLGQGMTGGTIEVNGNAEGAVGESMEGGRILVGGNVEFKLGAGMKGGTIEVNGNGGRWVGHWMAGGEIHINGDYDWISSDIKGGRIYHKGKLIFPGDG